MDQVGRRREEIVVGGGDHFREDAPEKNGAKQRGAMLVWR